MSIDSGTCPLLWKKADITPIYKKGDASQVSNYRPISILPAMCRLFERILADDINFHLHHNRLITDAQYGFVKGRSTELQFINCSKMWINAIDSNKFVDTVYIGEGRTKWAPQPKWAPARLPLFTMVRVNFHYWC